MAMQCTSPALAKDAGPHLCIKTIHVEVNYDTVGIRNDLVVGEPRSTPVGPTETLFGKLSAVHAVGSFVAAGDCNGR